MKNLGRAFAFMFEDKDWIQKILIGAAFVLLSVILVGIPLVLGYLLEVARRSAEGQEVPLPDWDNLGDKFGKGLLFFIILIIYSIPITIVSFILQLIPCIGALLGLVVWLVFWMIVPYLAVQYARTGNFNTAFEFDKIITFVKENITNLLIVLVMSIVFSIIAQFGVLALIIGLLFTTFWAGLGTYYLYGQLFYEAEHRAVVVETQTPAGPPPSDSAGSGDAPDNQ
jgi:hypothetical protein